jgi:tryptophan-rich sensory protein
MAMLGALNRALDDAVDDGLNARGRSATHVAAGIALCGGALLASALAGYHDKPVEKAKDRLADASLRKPGFAPSERTFSAVMPPMFLLLTFSGIRIWNAPPSERRSRALVIWGVLQLLHAAETLWSPKQKSAQLATQAATMAGALAYANDARAVDPPSAAIIAPYVSWMAFANLLTAEVWRRNKDRPDVK